MRMTRLWMAATALILLLVVGLVVASCGGTTATTDSTPSTTAAQTTDTANPPATTAGEAVAAAAMYSRECAGCHPSIPRAPGGVNQVRGVITMGKGFMPPFSSTLTVDQIVALATWVGNGGR
jgi:mono/diheme cytochrome c family protein